MFAAIFGHLTYVAVVKYFSFYSTINMFVYDIINMASVVFFCCKHGQFGPHVRPTKKNDHRPQITEAQKQNSVDFYEDSDNCQNSDNCRSRGIPLL
jgi:hypothetical protein